MSVSKVLNMCLQLKSQFFYNDLALRKIALPWWYLQTTSWAIISSTNPNIWDDHCTICFTYNTQTMSADTETQRLEVVLSHQEMKKGKKTQLKRTPSKTSSPGGERCSILLADQKNNYIAFSLGLWSFRYSLLVLFVLEFDWVWVNDNLFRGW